MKLTLVFLFISIFATGCGSITKMIEKQKKAQEIAKNKTYDLSLEEMKVKLVEYFQGWRSVNPDKRVKRIKMEIDKGFVYNKQYYQKYEPGLIDFFSALSAVEKDSLSKYFTKANYHTIEDNKDGFKLVFDGMIYDVKSVSPEQSKIKVYTFQKIERGPYELDLNWSALVLKHRGLFMIRKGPVLLEESMKHSRRSTITETDLLGKLAPEVYDNL